MKGVWMKGNVLQAASRSDAITSPSIAGGEVFLFGPSQKPWRCRLVSAHTSSEGPSVTLNLMTRPALR